MKHHGDICLILSPAGDMNRFTLIQRIDNGLMDLPVELHIQRIDLDGLVEYFFKITADLRNRKGNDRKAPLLLTNIAVLDEHIISSVIHGKLLLLRRVGGTLALCLRRK